MYSDNSVTKEYVDNSVKAASEQTSRSAGASLSQVDARQSKSISHLKLAVIVLAGSSILLWATVLSLL